MELDVELLSRLQFAFTIMFHYIFPPLSIGLGWLLVIMEGMFLKTNNPVYEQMTRFFVKIFAVNFAMGVATGIVMEFQFGTNWAVYSRYVGDIFGSALAAEGIFAFFLESGFLGVLVFGWDRVSRRMHFISTLLVAIGATFSAVWIVVANSWQQTPTGYHIVGEGLTARAEITGFWAMVFNPSSMHRLNHVLIGALILGGFFVMSITAYYILKNRHVDMAKRAFGIGLVMACLASLAALVSGHLQAQEVSETQPAKLAAFEGHFKQDGKGAPLWVFGFPDAEEERVKYGIPIPGMLSFMVHEDFNEPVTALGEFPEEDRPPVFIPFMTYHLMVGIGMFNIVLTLFAVYLWRKGTLFEKRGLLWVFVFAVIGPYLANQAGWVAAEVGRQPWIVYGLLRTSEGLSQSVQAEQVLWSIMMFGLIYLMLFAIWVYVLNDKIKHGPQPLAEGSQEPSGHGFMEAATRLSDPASAYSMSEARDQEPGDDKEEK